MCGSAPSLSVLILAGERVNMCVGQRPLHLSVLILAGERVNVCGGSASPLSACVNFSW